MRRDEKTISIVVPAYNEEKLLPSFLKELLNFLKGLSYELIIIENGSTDRTLELIEDFAKKNKKIIVKHLLKPGYGQALIEGLRMAKGEFVVIFNVDFWDKELLNLAKISLLGYDVIVGSKTHPFSRDLRPFSRRLVTRFYNFFLNSFFKYRGSDTHGIKVFNRKKILPLIKSCQTKTGIFDSEILIRAQRGNLKILEIPVKVKERRPNRFGLKRIFETPLDLFRLSRALK